MTNLIKRGGQLTFVAALLALTAAVASAQVPNANTTGTVTINGTVSRFVELTAGDTGPSVDQVGPGDGTQFPGGATLNASGATPARGPKGPALSVTVNLSEVGPSNLSAFVRATVPLKLRSNAGYTLAMSATSTGTSDVVLADVGFGITGRTRSGVGVVPDALATDTIVANAGDPTTATFSLTADGRYQYDATNGDLADFSASNNILTGGRILNPVPRENTEGLRFNAVYAVKPQFYSNGSVLVTVSFTATTP